MDKLAYSVEESYQLIGVGRSVMFELLASGEIESVKVGRRRLVPRVALEGFLARKLAEQKAGDAV